MKLTPFEESVRYAYDTGVIEEFDAVHLLMTQHDGTKRNRSRRYALQVLGIRPIPHRKRKYREGPLECITLRLRKHQAAWLRTKTQDERREIIQAAKDGEGG